MAGYIKNTPEEFFVKNIAGLGNFYATKDYRVSDNGMILNGSKKDLPICQHFVIKSIFDEPNEDTEYVEILFKKRGKVSSYCFRGDEFGETDCISILKSVGFQVMNKGEFQTLTQIMKLSINRFEEENEDDLKADGNLIVNHDNVYLRYGFQKVNCKYQLDKFITDKEIVKQSSANSAIDEPLFKTEGTFEGQKADLESIAKYFRPYHIFQSIVGITCTSIVLPFLGTYIANPIYCIAGPSSVGKGFAASIQASIWGHPSPTGKGILRGKDTDVAWSLVLTRLHNLPVINTEMQDVLYTDGGLGTVRQKFYEFTEGTFGERSVGKTLRGDNRYWRNTWCFYCEAVQLQQLNGGAHYRYVMLDTGLIDGEKFTGNVKTMSLAKYTETNYGYIGIDFTNKLIEYAKTHSIVEEFNEIDNLVLKNIKNDKIAHSVALLIYTYNKMIDFESIPHSLGKIDIDEYCSLVSPDNINKNPIIDTVEKLIENIPGSYDIRRLDEIIGEEEYRNLASTPKEVRGRYEIINGRLKAYFPEDKLIKKLEKVAEDNNIDGFVYSRQAIAKAGFLAKNTAGKLIHKKSNITRVYTKEKGAESVIVIDVPYKNDEEPKLTKEDIKDII